MNVNYQEHYKSLYKGEFSLAERVDLWENRGLRKLVSGIQIGSAVIGLIGIVGFTIGCIASAGIIGGILGVAFIASRVCLLIAIPMGIICLMSTAYKAMKDVEAESDTTTASFKKRQDEFKRLSHADFEGAWSALNQSKDALLNGEPEEAQEVIRQLFQTNFPYDYDTYITLLALIKENDLIEKETLLVETISAVFDEYNHS